MKRLNRKGFTLVELLAVIVILAIVVGITMATILPTLQSARKESFAVALDTIEKYIQDQVELYTLGPAAQGSNYVKAVGEGYLSCKSTTAGAEPTTLCTKDVTATDGTTTADILKLTEYEANISQIKWYVDYSGNVKIKCATINTNGDYAQGTDTSKDDARTFACS